MDKNDLIKYNGNEEEFNSYRIELENTINGKIIYNSKIRKKIKTSEGNLICILYDEYDDNLIIYRGYFKKGKYDGFGQLYNGNNKLIYEGFFKEDKYNGKGTYYKNNKKKYEGNFLNGEYDGIGIEYLSNGKRKRKSFYSKGKIKKECYGILYNENGEEIYNGPLLEGLPKKGRSIIIYSDNDDFILYKGDFESFQYNGKGVLYYSKSIYYEKEEKIKFDGIFRNNKYAKGILYYENGYKEYEGEFKEDKYEGKGILYFERNNKIFYEGSFIQGEFKNGILYDLKNKIIYQGDFKRNIPKKGKDIKLYRLNGYLKYEGDISNFLYEGIGKMIYENNKTIFKGVFKEGNKIYGIFYNNSRKMYEGEFEDDKLNGYGKIYQFDNNNNYLFYEGNFEDSEIFGKGVKYYSDGSKKIEGYFQNVFLFNGIYYNPNNIPIFEGENSYEILTSKKFILYNDNGEDIYNEKIMNGYTDYFNKKVRKIKATLISKGLPGKTSLLIRLTENKFSHNILGTIGIDSRALDYEYQTDLYKMIIYDTSGGERFRSISYGYIKNADIVIIVFDLSKEDSIDDSLLNTLEDYSNSKEKLIYLVGNKLDKDSLYLEDYREKSKNLIDAGKINKYFEVSAKTGEGIDNFSNTLKIDAAIFYMTLKFREEKIEHKRKNLNHIENLSEKLKNLEENLSPYLKNMEKEHLEFIQNMDRNNSSLSIFKKLNKYINY